MEKIEIGGTPTDEACAQIGITDDFARLNRLECRCYIAALTKKYGAPPEGASFVVVPNVHDFGTYREVAIRFDGENEGHRAYADKVESGLSVWRDAGFYAPVVYDEKSQATCFYENPDMWDQDTILGAAARRRAEVQTGA